MVRQTLQRLEVINQSLTVPGSHAEGEVVEDISVSLLRVGDLEPRLRTHDEMPLCCFSATIKGFDVPPVRFTRVSAAYQRAVRSIICAGRSSPRASAGAFLRGERHGPRTRKIAGLDAGSAFTCYLTRSPTTANQSARLRHCRPVAWLCSLFQQS